MVALAEGGNGILQENDLIVVADLLIPVLVDKDNIIFGRKEDPSRVFIIVSMMLTKIVNHSITYFTNQAITVLSSSLSTR